MKPIKCVVWDLDNTLWQGVLLEEPQVALSQGAADVLDVLDTRGILHSIASRNDADLAMIKLREFRIDHFFLHPQIGWGSKARSVEAIARALNLGQDAVAFVDDDAFERDGVRHELPDVRCYAPDDLETFVGFPELTPVVATEDGRRRREMYQTDLVRGRAEVGFEGPNEEFLASLHMHMTVARAGKDDLPRAEELTVRTHQLNTTGRAYSFEELDELRCSEEHLLLMAGLSDCYGSYGKIGLCLVHVAVGTWTIKLLLMSCRVLARGVGSVLLAHVMHRARDAGAQLRSEFVPNERNRVMYVTYKFAGFSELSREGGVAILAADLERAPRVPAWLVLEVVS